jgi:LPXTG-site transpeptidase (sortase) family protein
MTRPPGGPGWVPPAHPVIRRGGLRPKLSLRAAALTLIGIGFLLCLVPIAVVGYGMWQENQLTQAWSTGVASSPPSPPFVEEPGASPTADAPTPAPTPPSTSLAQEAAFAIRVPKIGYYAAVRQGVSLSVLAYGPGHYPTTAMPGQPGLVGIAAHNTFWIPFGQLGPGDSVILETRAGRYTYRVTGTRIVNPNDTGVLAPTSDPRLVLTTCWPLWAGNLAAQRLAIFAQEI